MNVAAHSVYKSSSQHADSIPGPAYSFDDLTGRFQPGSHPDFVAIPAPYAAETGMYMRKAAFAAFKDMADAATKDGVSLRIISATRNFDRQKQIWEGKWLGKRLVDGQDLSKTIADPAKRAAKILEFSSMPGTSRHHWGTDIDLNSLQNSYFDKGTGLKVYQWLVAHAGSYGFCQPYSARSTGRTTGYEEEKWHWSYTPIAQPLTQMVRQNMTDADIKGFLGAQTAAALDVRNHYMLGINEACGL